MGICIHGARYFDSVIAEGFNPPMERRRAGSWRRWRSIYTIFETDIFPYTRYKKALIAPTAEDRDYNIREIPIFKSAGDVPVLMGFDRVPINMSRNGTPIFACRQGGRRWGEASGHPEPKARPSSSAAPEPKPMPKQPPPKPREGWFMGTAMDATTQVHEMRHKGVEPISVEFDAFQGYPMKWHLEGPATIDPSVSRFAVYARRML